MIQQLSKYTTLNIGGYADIAVITNANQLDGLVNPYIIGRGSKLLVSDSTLNRRVAIMRTNMVELDGCEVITDSGVTMPKLVKVARKANLSGLEWACGIPASIGGAVMMNAGAYGSCIADVLVAVEVYGKGWIKASDLDMSYRHTDGIDGIVTRVRLKLCVEHNNMIQSRIGECDLRRVHAQPQGKCAGSSFKAIDGVSAGYYIDKAGLKGYRIGGAEISTKHANFIMNVDNASAGDVKELLDVCKMTVAKKFKIKLEEEIIYVGEF